MHGARDLWGWAVGGLAHVVGLIVFVALTGTSTPAQAHANTCGTAPANLSPYSDKPAAVAAANVYGAWDVCNRNWAREHCIEGSGPDDGCGARNPRYELVEDDVAKTVSVTLIENGAPRDGSPLLTTHNRFVATYSTTVEEEVCQLAANHPEWLSVQGKPAVGSETCTTSGCTAVWESTVSYTNKQTQQTETEGQVRYTGTTCTGNPNADPRPDQCKGGYWGQVGGVDTCIKFDPNQNTVTSSKSKSESTTTTTTNPDESTSTETGTETTTETTTCEGGKCTTTKETTTTTGDGTTTTKEESVEQSQDDFCTANPKHPVCENAEEGKFSGACDAGFTCEGDAVQCAVARDIHVRNCQMHAFDEADVNKGLEARTKGIPDEFWSTVNLSTVLPAAPTSTCPFVASSIVMGEGVTAWTIPLDLSQVCPYIEKIRAVVVSFGMVMFALIVLGRK